MLAFTNGYGSLFSGIGGTFLPKINVIKGDVFFNNTGASSSAWAESDSAVIELCSFKLTSTVDLLENRSKSGILTNRTGCYSNSVCNLNLRVI